LLRERVSGGPLRQFDDGAPFPTREAAGVDGSDMSSRFSDNSLENMLDEGSASIMHEAHQSELNGGDEAVWKAVMLLVLRFSVMQMSFKWDGKWRYTLRNHWA
jgi:hypothetical protein